MSYNVALMNVALLLVKWPAQLYGMLPFSFEAYAFRHSRAWLWYCRIIALILSVVYACAYVRILQNLSFPLLALSFYLVIAQFALNYAISITLYLQVLVNPSTMLRVFNELFKNIQALLKCTFLSDQSSIIIIGRRLLFKFVVDLMLCLPWYAEYMWYSRQHNNPGYLLAFSLNTVAVLQLVAAANIVQCVLLWGIFLYRLINERVQLTIGSMLQMDTNKDYWNNANSQKRVISNHVCRHLNILRGQHYTLTECIRQIAGFYNLPLALIMCHQFLIVISELFYAYTSFVQDVRAGNEVQVEKYISSIIFAAFEALQFYFIVSAFSEIAEQAEKTGILINEFLQTDAGLSVERSIEAFSIELLHQEFKIDNYGLYNIDYTLMFSMIATITSYLIMLVQFQLAEA